MDHETKVESILTPRLQSLVAYLLLHSESPVSRQQLAYLLWPDTSDAQARSNLRHLIHNLKTALPKVENWIILDNHTVQWRTDSLFSLDIDQFEHASTQNNSIQALQSAVQLYSGDLLPGCYEDWIAPERERLRQIFIAALEKLVLLLEARREHDTAIQFAQLLLQHDPLHESAYRRLMRLFAIKGDRLGALRVYHACATILQRELNVEPGSKTQNAYRRLLSLDDPIHQTLAKVSVHIPLVGRKQEWAALQSAWQDKRVEQPHLILLSGEAGIGKTRLAEELVEWAQRQGIQVSKTYCAAAQRELAYAPLVTLLRSYKLPALDECWLCEISRLLPELLSEYPNLSPPEPIKESWQRYRLFEAIARTLLGNRGTRFFFLDDLQYCDRDTLGFLQYLLNLTRSRPDLIAGRKLLLLGTLRVEEETLNPPLTELLSILRRCSQLTEIALHPLDENESKLLANFVSGRDISPDEARNLYRETEGNPLFIVETIRAGFPTGIPSKIQAVIFARLLQISQLARKLADLAAVIGRGFSYDVLAEASGQSEEDLVINLDELWQLYIIREQGSESYDFSHDKIREVIYTSLSSACRRLLHRRVAQAIEKVHQGALEAVSGQIGYHFERAGLLEKAVLYNLQAADSARKVFANHDAIHFLQRCLDIIQIGPASALVPQEMIVQIYEDMGEVYVLIGEYPKAREAYQSAIPSLGEADHVRKASLQRKIGNTWREQSQFDQALAIYKQTESILAAVSGCEDAQWWHEWIQVKLEQMLVHYWISQPDQIQDLLDEAGPIVERSGSKNQQAKYYLAHTRMDLRRERYRLSEQTVARQRLARKLIQESGSMIEIADHQFNLGFTLLWSGNLVEAEEALQSALALAEKIGDRQLQTRCLTYLTILFRLQRRAELVRSYAARNLAAAMETNLPEYICSAMANQAWLAWREGKPEQAEALALEALTRLANSRIGLVFKWLAFFPLIDICLKEQRLEQAIQFAGEILAPGQQLLPEAISNPLEKSIENWEANDKGNASEQLYAVIELAGQLGYL